MDDPLLRPRTVTVAGFVALASCVLVATYLVIALATFSSGSLPDGPDAAGVDRVRWISVVFLVWTVGAAALAWFTLRGSSRARWVLLGSAALAGSVSLTAAAFLAAALVPLLACVVTISLLFAASSRGWFRARKA